MPDDPIPAPVANPAEAFQALLAKKNNDGVALASQLFDENYQLRTKLREAKAATPKDGTLVLAAEDAKEWEAFKALNMKAADAKKALDAVPDLEKQNKELAGMESLRELADIGLDGSKLKLSVLKDQLARYPEAKISFKSEKDKDGKEAKVAYIQKTAKEAETSFTDFASKELADYLPSLKVSNEAYTPIPPGNTGDPKPQGGASAFFDRIRETVKKSGEENKPADIDQRFGRTATV